MDHDDVHWDIVSTVCDQGHWSPAHDHENARLVDLGSDSSSVPVREMGCDPRTFMVTFTGNPLSWSCGTMAAGMRATRAATCSAAVPG